MSNFTQYYQRTIEKHQKGLKLVLGGTGLGKTSAIPKIINLVENKNKKFIYVANRIQLLKELKNNLEDDIVVHQLSDYQIIGEIDILPLFDNEVIKNYADCLSASQYIISQLSTVKKEYLFIKKKYDTSTSNEDIEILREKAGIVTRFFRRIIVTAFWIKNNKVTLPNSNKLSKTDHSQLVNNELIRLLFPYIEFIKNPKKKILLVTIQKAFYGFFNGERSINLYNLSSESKEDKSNKVIFLDEFDFLENELLTLISQDLEISQPFFFVRDFYNALTKNKLTNPSFLNTEAHSKYKTEIEKIIAVIDELKNDYNINFPEISHFICNEQDDAKNKQAAELRKKLGRTKTEEARSKIKEELREINHKRIRGSSIFQTRHSISNAKIYLEQETRPNSFNLTLDKGKSKATAFALLSVVYQATADIIRIFKDMEYNEPNLHKSMLRYCFESSDNFQEMLRKIKQYPYQREARDTKLDKFFQNGFGLYEIYDLRDENDPEEVNIKYYAIFTTPEKILANLTTNNLVFGLSATAEIPRLVKNFDNKWLQKELGTNFIDIENDDIEDIKKGNEIKQSKRQTKIEVVIAEVLDNKIETEKLINKFIDAEVSSKATDEFGEEIFSADRSGYRRNRVKLFFKTLSWIAQNKNQKVNDTHLIFFSSFRQIKYIFDKFPTGTGDKLFKINKLGKEQSEDNLFEYYKIEYQNSNYNVVFYNAEKAKDIYRNKEALAQYYSIFWEKEVSTILITTYPTAGNGVNLQYFTSKRAYEEGQNPNADFSNIHLLDAPFYYFNPIASDAEISEKNATIKRNIYYLAKLYYAKSTGISRNHFSRQLESIRSSGNFNKEYLGFADGIFNQIAVFIQALGRIERVWQNMPHQTIRLNTDIYNIIEEFVTNNNYKSTKKRISNYFSNNINQLFEYIETKHKERAHLIEQYKQEDLTAINNKTQSEIRILLDKLNVLRAHPNHAKSTEIRKEWNKLRQVALRHDFNELILKKYHATFETDFYDHYNRAIHIDKDYNVVPRQVADYSFMRWQLNSIYNAVRENQFVRNYFELQQFEIGFNTHGRFYTPCFYQSILIGAIGEELIKAIFTKPKSYDKETKKTIELGEPIELDEDEIPNELFELIDTKIKGKNWFIDCKNFNERTLQNFQLDENDLQYNPNLNEKEFRRKGLNKLQQISNFYQNEDCKIFYINALGNENDDRAVGYYDENFEELPYTRCSSFSDFWRIYQACLSN